MKDQTCQSVLDALIAQIEANHQKLLAIVRDPAYLNPATDEVKGLHRERAALFTRAQAFKALIAPAEVKP